MRWADSFKPHTLDQANLARADRANSADTTTYGQEELKTLTFASWTDAAQCVGISQPPGPPCLPL